MYQQQQQPSIPVSGEITGWFGRARTRLFGQRDKVEEQMRDIARQGSAGARVSHWFAGLLIILFSLASLVSLGGDAFRAVVASLQHGVLDIPNAIALGVTALLVPAMDVAVLQAASVYRLLRMRRAELGDMWLHALVIGGISVIEAGTYCYMAGVYEHPVGGVAWTLIIARALAAPLIAVYLAMARPLPVTSRDILAQVELGAGQGVIRDVSKIANDPSAPLARKMELFGASAVMGEHEEDKLNRLIAVAQKGLPPALPAGHTGVPSVKIHAAATLPDVEPQAHYSAPSYGAMHGDSVEWDDRLPDGVEDEALRYEDEHLYDTMEVSTPSRPLVDSTPVASSGGRGRINAGFADGMGDDFPLDSDEDDADYPSYSAHQRKKGKSSSGHRNQRQYKAQRATEVQATRERGRAIDQATNAVFAEVMETGENPSDYDLVERVNEHLERMGSSVRTSRTAVRKRKADWLAQMGLNSATDRTERELQEVWQ